MLRIRKGAHGVLVLSLLLAAVVNARAATIFIEDFSGDSLSPTTWNLDPNDLYASFGDFGVTTDGWLKMGVVNEDEGGVGLAIVSALPLLVGPGSYLFEFDYLPSLSNYYTNIGFDAFTSSFGSSTLFVEDRYNGFEAYFPTIERTGRSDGWLHISYSFAISGQDVDIAPWFTLEDYQNGTTGDSFVYLDNIVISTNATPVPEPATWLLLGAGLGALSLLRRRRP